MPNQSRDPKPRPRKAKLPSKARGHSTPRRKSVVSPTSAQSEEALDRRVKREAAKEVATEKPRMPLSLVGDYPEDPELRVGSTGYVPSALAASEDPPRVEFDEGPPDASAYPQGLDGRHFDWAGYMRSTKRRDIRFTERSKKAVQSAEEEDEDEDVATEEQKQRPSASTLKEV